jgi:hypothetical protein
LSEDTAATMPPEEAVRVGRYVLGRQLGSSARGDLHVATDDTTSRHVVALKRVRHAIAAGDAAALVGLAHPGVVPVVDAGTAAGRGYIATALVDAMPIDRWVRTQVPSPARIVAAFRAAGRGLAAAHAAGIVHGAVAAGNILVDRDGVARIADFTLAPSAAGTAPADAAEDQHAFATALHDALGGAAVAPRIERALDRARAADPAARFPSLTALVAALGPSRRGPVVAGAVAAAAIAAIVAALAWPSEPAPVADAAAPPAVPRADVAATYPLVDEPGACAASPYALGNGVLVYERTSNDDVNLYRVALPHGKPGSATAGAAWSWRPNHGPTARDVLFTVTDPTRHKPSRLGVLVPANGDSIVLPWDPTAFVRDALALGDDILYATGGGIHQLGRGGDRLLLRMPEEQELRSLAISADNRWLATTGMKAGGGKVVSTIDTWTKHVEPIVRKVTDGRPAFSRTGPWLYFSGPEGVWSLDLRTRHELQITQQSAPGGIAVTGDGSSLVLSQCRPHRSIVDTSTSPPTVVRENAFAPSLAADGALAFLAEVKGDIELQLRSPRGDITRLALGDAEPTRDTAISPDGHRVAYVAAATTSTPGISIAETGNTRESVQLTTGEDHVPRWVDDDRFVFTRIDSATGNPTLYLATARGGEPVRLADRTTGLAARRGEVLVVRDGAAAWRDIATGRERPSSVPTDVVDAAVSPSGQWLAYETADGRVWRVDLAANTALELVLALPSTQIIGHVAVGNDGHVLASPLVWEGGLVVVPAATGSRF